MQLTAERVLFLAAHCDDEMLAAGTLHRLVRQGAEVHVCAMGPCATQEDRVGGQQSEQDVLPEYRSSLGIIGAVEPTPLSRWYAGIIPSSRMAEWPQRVGQFIYDAIERWRPDLVFTLSPTDENPAHAVVGQQTERVARGRVPTLVRVHCPWNYQYGHCNLYVELDGSDLQCKRDVVNAYQSQKFRYDYETALLSYAVADGLSVKVPAAERFELVRSVL